MTLDLGVLIPAGRFQQLKAGELRAWRALAFHQEMRFGVRKHFFAAAGTDIDARRTEAIWAGPDGWRPAALVPLPHLIYNLLARPGRADAQALRRLNAEHGLLLFNETNRLGCGPVLDMLAASPAVSPFLPPAYGRWDFGGPVGPAGPVDWRVYVLRNSAGRWDVAATVAKPSVQATTLPGARCWPLGVALALTFGPDGPTLEQCLRTAAVAVMEALTRFIPGLAHAAADFWIDRNRQIALVDLRGRFRVDWVRQAGDMAGLQRLLDHPVRFAGILERAGITKLDVDFGRVSR